MEYSRVDPTLKGPNAHYTNIYDLLYKCIDDGDHMKRLNADSLVLSIKCLYLLKPNLVLSITLPLKN